MARVVLHIGIPGTDAALIQSRFAENAGLLARHGLIFPHSGTGSGTSMTAGEALAAALRGLAERRAAQPGDTVLLAATAYARGQAGTPADFRVLRAALAGFDEIAVICVLRMQWQALQALYVEKIRSRAPKNPADLLESMLHRNMAAGFRADYTRLYDHLLTAFAPEEITFLDHGACCGPGQDMPGSLLAHLGIAIDPASLVGGHNRQMPPALAALAAQRIAAPHPVAPWLHEAAAGAFRVQHGETAESCIWSRGDLARLRDHSRTFNARLAARLAGRQPQFALTDAAGPDHLIHPEDLGAGFWLRTNRWGFALSQRPPRPAAPPDQPATGSGTASSTS